MSRGLRNNNPGNIRQSNTRYLGEVRPSQDAAFKQFETAAWGIAAQVKRRHFALSELGRNGMLSKLALYASVIVGFIVIEHMTGAESQIAVIAICTLICVVELWSMGGSALIVNPRMRFLRLFREVLAGEVARKLNTTVEEAKRYLDGDDGTHSPKTPEQ